eukprot:2555722-Prymnesium_polylepis.1
MMREQFTGQAYDGQYQGAEQRSFTGLSVPVHLANKLNINPSWVLSRCALTPCAHVPPPAPLPRRRRSCSYYPRRRHLLALSLMQLPAPPPPALPLEPSPTEQFAPPRQPSLTPSALPACHQSYSWLALDRRWDPAHKIELAMNDVRKGSSPKVRFYVELSPTVAESQTPFLHGKGFERITVAWQKHKLRGGSIGSVCTTRFCASERKVYKAFFRNLTVFIADQLAEGADVNALDSIRCVTFVIHICGTIDLLRPLKDLSLTLQAVNNLPWELDVLIT